MLIRYIGGRPSLSTTCSGRVSYYFGPENDFICEVTDAKHIEQLLSSELNKFTTVEARLPVDSAPPVPAGVKPPENKKEVEKPKKRGRKKHG